MFEDMYNLEKNNHEFNQQKPEARRRDSAKRLRSEKMV